MGSKSEVRGSGIACPGSSGAESVALSSSVMSGSRKLSLMLVKTAQFGLIAYSSFKLVIGICCVGSFLHCLLSVAFPVDLLLGRGA